MRQCSRSQFGVSGVEKLFLWILGVGLRQQYMATQATQLGLDQSLLLDFCVTIMSDIWVNISIWKNM